MNHVTEVVDAKPTSQAHVIDSLTSRTFIGLLVAQFLAAFNDQAIHASAMFYAINSQVMTERDAIALMPILFYAPWAIFCTVSGWLADRYSKRSSLVFWKIAEVVIATITLLGFYLGGQGHTVLGPIIVLGTVFCMGMHSAFFVPSKYGVMPEILPEHLLSKGNGLLESLSFLAVILGTVSGGVLSSLFLGREVIIGLILLGLAIVGAIASFLIDKVPAADPTRPFPPYIFGPLVSNVRMLLSVPSLRIALQGIAFFTFVVAFMRAAVYMLGESQNPRWDELKTSAVVGTVAMGIGLGSPLAGWLSGRKIELRLVLVGASGMIVLLLAAAQFLGHIPLLITCIIGIGFFTGFYIVPLFTLLQHEAPRENKGEMIATSNFVNVTGAIVASLMFFMVVYGAQKTGLAPQVTDRTNVCSGNLTKIELSHGRPVFFEVTTEDGQVITGGVRPDKSESRSLGMILEKLVSHGKNQAVLEVDKEVPLLDRTPMAVDISKFTTAGVVHYDIVPAGKKPAPDYDNRMLPRYLFMGAAGLTLITLLMLGKPIFRLYREKDFAHP